MNFLIQNGSVYDPMTHSYIDGDIAISAGKIVEASSVEHFHHVINADGCIVTTGLVDYHSHYFTYGSENSMCPDSSTFCNGVTTTVDAGTCGVASYELFHRSVIAMSEVRILGCLLASSGGQINESYPENLNPDLFNEERILEQFEKFDELVALKMRVSKFIADADLTRRALKRAVEIAEKANRRMVVHVTDCAIPLTEVAEILRPGDVICHIYHGKDSSCLDSDGKVLEGLRRARERGIIFDGANGRMGYDVSVCQRAIADGFAPDIISSDFNSLCAFLYPLHSLPRIMSKYVSLGMSLEDVIDCATINPAKLVGMPELASLATGTVADISIFKMVDKEISHRDVNNNEFIGDKILVPQMCIKGGKCVYSQVDFL